MLTLFMVLSVEASASDVQETLDGATGLVIRGVAGDAEVVAGAGDQLSVTGTGGADGRPGRKGGVWVVTVKDADDGLALKLTVPSSLAALTVHEQVGRLVVRDLPTRLAVVSGTGPVEVAGAANLRVSHLVGDVIVDRVANDLLVDQLTGTL